MGEILDDAKYVQVNVTIDDLHKALSEDKDALRLMLATLGIYFLKMKAPTLYEVANREIVVSKLSNVGLDYRMAKNGLTKQEAFGK